MTIDVSAHEDRLRGLRVGAGEDVVSSRSLDAVCHDLRNHLATTRLMAEVAATGPETPVGVREQLVMLCRELSTAMALVCSVDQARGAAGVVDLTAVAHDAVAAASWSFGARLTSRLAPASVRGDALDLRRVLDNLLVNALRAAGPHGRVDVDLAVVEGDVVRLRVDDSGPGFGQAAPRVSSLGLRIVRGLLEDVGGQLRLGRSELGGARCEVELAAHAALSESLDLRS